MGNLAPRVPLAVTANCATAEQRRIARFAVDARYLKPGLQAVAHAAAVEAP